MKVFISWSGDRSKALAEILRQWLPAVIQAVKPYYSPDDVAKGTRWSSEIAKELEASRVGLICLTPDNLVAPWVMFEAGALSKNLDRSRVCPILFGVEPSDIEGPLVQFQACRFNRDEIERVIRMMNSELADQALSSNVLDSVFSMWWPKLEEKVASELARKIEAPQAARTERDLLEEILGLTRSITRSGNRESLSPAALNDLDEAFTVLRELAELDSTEEPLRAAVRALSRPVNYMLRRRDGVNKHINEAEVRRAARLRSSSERAERLVTEDSRDLADDVS